MDKFDREIQNEILKACIVSYPSPPSLLAIIQPKIENLLTNKDEKIILANLFYLKDHELITFSHNCNRCPIAIFDEMTITAKGIDFMLNDGGLSSILNVQTVKLHRETIVVLEDLIAISNMSDLEKEKAKSNLGDMSTEAIKAVVSTVTTAGLSMLLGK
nr:hypothetical protein [Pantoea sp. 201603H]